MRIAPHFPGESHAQKFIASALFILFAALSACKALEFYNTRATTTQCFSHRAFFQYSTF